MNGDVYKRQAFRNNGTVSVKNHTDVLAAMIPIIFTGLATCVMFSANQFNLGAEGGIMPVSYTHLDVYKRQGLHQL